MIKALRAQLVVPCVVIACSCASCDTAQPPACVDTPQADSHRAGMASDTREILLDSGIDGSVEWQLYLVLSEDSFRDSGMSEDDFRSAFAAAIDMTMQAVAEAIVRSLCDFPEGERNMQRRSSQEALAERLNSMMNDGTASLVVIEIRDGVSTREELTWTVDTTPCEGKKSDYPAVVPPESYIQYDTTSDGGAEASEND